MHHSRRPRNLVMPRSSTRCPLPPLADRPSVWTLPGRPPLAHFCVSNIAAWPVTSTIILESIGFTPPTYLTFARGILVLYCLSPAYKNLCAFLLNRPTTWEPEACCG